MDRFEFHKDGQIRDNEERNWIELSDFLCKVNSINEDLGEARDLIIELEEKIQELEGL